MTAPHPASDIAEQAVRLVHDALEPHADRSAFGDLTMGSQRAALIAVRVLRDAGMLRDEPAPEPATDPLDGLPDLWDRPSTREEATRREHLEPLLYDLMDSTVPRAKRDDALRHLAVCDPARALAYLGDLVATIYDHEDRAAGMPSGSVVRILRTLMNQRRSRNGGNPT